MQINTVLSKYSAENQLRSAVCCWFWIYRDVVILFCMATDFSLTNRRGSSILQLLWIYLLWFYVFFSVYFSTLNVAEAKVTRCSTLLPSRGEPCKYLNLLEFFPRKQIMRRDCRHNISSAQDRILRTVLARKWICNCIYLISLDSSTKVAGDSLIFLSVSYLLCFLSLSRIKTIYATINQLFWIVHVKCFCIILCQSNS